ncbi:hypothetical protein [Duganella sp. BuS-21]|uniref:hypothetical protein n=1 Tax=Duganella sp. BuS-21 TaxID=2943848 RepID=UPI0035A5904D
MKTFTQIIAITLCSLPLLANAAGKSASAAMQVSFEVKESCTVQTADKAAKAAPAVACQLKTPYQLQRATAPAAAVTDTKAGAIRQEAAPGEWTLYF